MNNQLHYLIIRKKVWKNQNPFVKSRRILNVLAISQQFKEKPSKIIGLENGTYEAFCFDEACIYIINELSKENGREPKFEEDKETNKTNNSDVIEWLKANNAKRQLFLFPRIGEVRIWQ